MSGQNLFNSIKLSAPSKSRFDLSHDVKLSCNMGQLIPTLAMECVPGDKFNIGCDSLLRFAPLISPVMHRMDVTMHYFFVPNRLVWPNWEKFITDPQAAVAFPTFLFGLGGASADVGTLANYLGIPKEPAGASVSAEVSALPFAAYQMIFNEYYRDQNMVAPVPFTLVDGQNNGANPGMLSLRNRAWEHDYFTSALPFAQKGAAVDIPLGDVTLKDNWQTGPDVTPVFRRNDGASTNGNLQQGAPGADGIHTSGDTASVTAYDPDGTLATEPTTINDLRRAFRVQEWLEKAARGGSRYVENILSFFGVKSPDARLNRPEYITGTKSPVVISEVLSTAETSGLPQANMAGKAVSISQGKYGGYFCQEHGYIIGIMSVMPKTAYMQGIPKHFLKINDSFEYYWPQFANIGEQEILNKEIYAFTALQDQVFGYTPRYAEYKFMQNRVCGDFQDTLDFWHMARIFDDQPFLNDLFITSNPTTRIFAVEDPAVQKLYCHVLHKISALRPMPKYGTPTF